MINVHPTLSKRQKQDLILCLLNRPIGEIDTSLIEQIKKLSPEH
ncbi:DUF4351 domain-containing protein [Nostoc sp. LEGE 06077]